MKIFLYFFILLMLSLQAAGAGIAVVPAELDFEMQKGEKQQKEILVYNLGESETKIHAKSDFEGIALDYSGILNGMDRIAVEVDSSKLKTGLNEALIRIVPKPQNTAVAINTGTAVKAVILVHEKKANLLAGLAISFAIAGFGTLCYLLAIKLVPLPLINKN